MPNLFGITISKSPPMCLHPILAAYNRLPNPSTGNVRIHFDVTLRDLEEGRLLDIPCGKCLGCMEDKANRWVNRLLLEYDDIGVGTFVTLTYRDAPLHPSKDEIQRFIKRLRNVKRDYGCKIDKRFKYFAVAEHGSKKGRVHYHAVFFGINMFEPEWMPYIVYFDKDNPVYSSKVLEKIWNNGYVTIGEVNSQSCKYMAKYMLKQEGQEDNFNLKSMRLGVGSFFKIEKNGRNINYRYRYADTFDRLFDGTVHISDKGKCKKIRIPPAILKYVEKIDPFDHAIIKNERQRQAIAFKQRDFDKNAYVARILDDKQKTKIRTKYHD